MPRAENRELLDQLVSRVCKDFGVESGRAIMRTIFEELGGFRITIPTLEDLHREERDSRIKLIFNGGNISELAERFGISKRHVRRIVTDG